MFSNFYCSRIDSADNSGNTALGSEKSSTVWGVSNSIPEHSHEVSQPDSFHNYGNKSIRGDQILKEPNEILSKLNRGTLPHNPIKLWKIYVVKTSIGWSSHKLI